MIGAVGAEPPSQRRRFGGRVVAIVVSLGLVVGGTVLAVNAGRSQGGADTPEAAVEAFLAALTLEDLLGAAEAIDPTERTALIDGGQEISEELKRLEVISEDLDLNAVVGLDLRFENLTLRSVLVRSDLSHVFITRASSRVSVDVSKLPLGRLVLEHAPADWLEYTDFESAPISRAEPFVVVERGGRWYVSLLYSLAENSRIAAKRRAPTPEERLAPIGAESPEAAVERLINELLRLDPRTAIGMLDPEEMAALYDYAVLFIDRAETTANDILQESSDNDVEWNVDLVNLSSSTNGDFATVGIERIEATLSTPDVTVGISMGDGLVVAELTAADLNGQPTRTEIRIGNGCTTVNWFGFTGPDTFDSCDRNDDQFAPIGVFALATALEDLAPLITTPAGAGLITHRVDGKWFVSPLRTGLGATIGLLRILDPLALDQAIESIKGSVVTMPGGFSTSFAEAKLLPFTEAADRFVSDFDLRSGDLVNQRAPAAFAVDHIPVLAESILAGWLPELDGTNVIRAVEVDTVSKAGGVMMFVMQLTDEQAASEAIDVLSRSSNATIRGSLIEVGNTQRNPVLVTAVSDRLIFAAGFADTPIELLELIMARQIPE